MELNEDNCLEIVAEDSPMFEHKNYAIVCKDPTGKLVLMKTYYNPLEMKLLQKKIKDLVIDSPGKLRLKENSNKNAN